MRRITLSTVLLLLAAPASQAQLSRPGKPASFEAGPSAELPVVVLPAPDVEAYKAEDALPGNKPWRYGAVVPLSVGLETDGRWDEVDGAFVWRIEISSPGAFSLGVLFHEFRMPEGAEVFLYRPDRDVVLGAYTRENEQENGMLAIQPLRGDRLVIEYVQPAWVTELPLLRVGEVVHDYRNVFGGVPERGESSSEEDSAACFIDINCPPGAPYQDIKRAVVEVFMGGGQCSAALLNNTAEDGTPYLLVADHCGDLTNVVAIFNYENPTCGGGGASQSQSLSGAVLLRRSSNYDSQLYRLNNTPPDSYQPFYAGWGRGLDPKVRAIGIHHAQGMPKKISIDDDAPGKSPTQWWVDWDQGMVHGGSSGSPLFNNRKRVIGPACCVNNFNCANQWTYYGRFDRFWAAKNLGQWLDPLGTGAVGIDGFDPVNPQAIPYYGSSVNPRIYSSSLPALGATWTADVDVSGQAGATGTLLVGYSDISTGSFFNWGELLVDTSSTLLFNKSAGVAGGVSSYSTPIPNDPALAGAVAHSQVLVLAPTLTATNGVKLRIR